MIDMGPFPPIPECIKTELAALDKLPELASTPFPFRGHDDFRRFTQDDYDNFSAGVFSRVSDPFQCKWKGGRVKANVALAKLQSLGYTVYFREPGIVELGSESDGYFKFKEQMYTLFFEPLSKP